MKRKNLNELREMYLDFFAEKDHIVMHSFPLIPQEDKSLLLINAGMAPLKKYFTGEKKFAKDRVATSQKCIRTQDIENVGRTQRHAAFFEMLGNFSFGDYFKKEAIEWAMEFLTEWLEIDRDLLWATVYEEDDSILIAAQSADDLLGIRSIDVSFVLSEIENGTHISARSLGDLSVQLIAEKLGGGGHQTSAGAQLVGVDMDEAEKQLIEAIRSYEKEEE